MLLQAYIADLLEKILHLTCTKLHKQMTLNTNTPDNPVRCLHDVENTRKKDISHASRY